jgi:membrane-associated phospholipid phosphatase
MSQFWKWCLLGSLLLFAAITVLSQTENPSGASEPTPAAAPSTPVARGAAAPVTENRGWLAPGADPNNRLGSPFLKHLASDQKEFWIAPARFKVKDLNWIAPSAGVLAAFVASDSWWAKQVPASHVATSKTFSDYTTYSFIGLGGASFLLGHLNHDDHLSEAGLLAGEATINSTAVAYLFKEITQRQRPYQGNGNGDFFTGGTSFPSEHSAIAWSVASVWAHEYPGWLSQIGAYGLAAAVSATRVTAQQHFPSDVIIGSALGWYFGRQVYRAHHDPEVGGSGWGSFIEQNTGEKVRNPNYMASPYVPLDSWIYPALERLIGAGYLQSAMLGMRPWTRLECARLLEDAEDNFPSNGAEAGEPGKLYATLRSEFNDEISRLGGATNVGARVESMYTRTLGISGTPLRDGFDFGQTIVNDYGRPYWTGLNNVTGIVADAEAGPASFYLRAEYQHAPAMQSSSPQLLNAIGTANFVPPLANGTAQVDSLELLDSMASFNINNLQISVGKLSEWLGPGESGSFLMSNNAAPFPMVKIDDVMPHEIPGLSRILGPLRTEFFVGQLSGQRWEFCQASSCQIADPVLHVVGPSISPQPFIHGEKISFQPTRNLEIGMGITAMFGGPGLPVTFGNFFRTYYVHTIPINNPGKRISAADFTYKVPHLRNWLTIYLDSLVTDEVSPIGSTRANVNPGIYLPHLPKIPKLEFRAEGINESRTREFTPGFVYYDGDRYRSGYTNNGVLLGDAFGRAARGEQAWLTYWFSSRDKLQLSYRLQESSPALLEGGRLADYSAKGEFRIGRDVSVSAFVQYEQWKFPIINPMGQSDVTASAQLTFYPHWQVR